MIDTIYLKQAELLLRIIPFIDRESVFALKGGTAINFFIRDLPRISVDIDLVYLPVDERDGRKRGWFYLLNYQMVNAGKSNYPIYFLNSFISSRIIWVATRS